MKKLTKEILFRFEKSFRILNTNEMRNFIGGDKYIFNASGQITDVIPESGNDMVYANGDTSGFELGQYTHVSSGMVGEQNRQGILISGASFELFEYFAKKTNVEWGLSYNSTSQKEEFNGTLSTNFDTSTIDPVFCKGDDSYIHSHPGNTKEVNKDDQTLADFVYSNRKFNLEYHYKDVEIYTPEDGERIRIDKSF